MFCEVVLDALRGFFIVAIFCLRLNMNEIQKVLNNILRKEEVYKDIQIRIQRRRNVNDVKHQVKKRLGQVQRYNKIR